jgi:hypothetical protein
MPFASIDNYTDENKKLDPLVEKISNNIAYGFKYNQITSAIYDQTYDQFKNAKHNRETRKERTLENFTEKFIETIKKEVDSRPIITKEILAGVSNKIFIDEVNYDYSKVLKIKEELKNKTMNDPITPLIKKPKI